MAEKPLCSIPDCDKPRRCGGYCKNHYLRWYRHGDPLAGRASIQTKKGEPERFLKEVVLKHTSDECLMWPFGKTPTGYPTIGGPGKKQYVHRIACEVANGPASDKNLDAAHSCGNASCVNGRHLRWATRLENESDKFIHDTTPRGARHGLAKLTDEKVHLIRELCGKLSQSAIARKFGISQSLVSCIHLRKAWYWLPENQSNR